MKRSGKLGDEPWGRGGGILKNKQTKDKKEERTFANRYEGEDWGRESMHHRQIVECLGEKSKKGHFDLN